VDGLPEIPSRNRPHLVKTLMVQLETCAQLMDTVTRLCRGELDELLKTPSAPKDTRVGGSANKVTRRIVAFHDLFDKIKLARQSYDHIFAETAEEIGRLNSTKEAHVTEAGLAQLRADVDVSSALSITKYATILLYRSAPNR
jgi:hypothetical protein